MTYTIHAIEGVGAAIREKLPNAQITNSDHLLANCAAAKDRRAGALAAKMKVVNETKKLGRRPPNPAEVEKSASNAKTLDALVTH